MKKKKKIPSEDIRELETNKVSWADIISHESFYFYPGKEEWRKRLIYTLFKWSVRRKEDENGDEALDLKQFCNEFKINKRSLDRWRNEYPDLEECVNQVKLVLASRRQIGSIKRRYDKEACYKDMHKYDPEWDEINKYHAALKEDISTQKIPDVIEVEKFSDESISSDKTKA